MKSLMFFILLACSIPSFASEYKFSKRVNFDKLTIELTAAGYQVNYMYGNGVDNTIVFKNNEIRNPQAIINAHVYVDLKAKIVTNNERMVSLARKWIKGTITVAEKDELIKRYIVSTLLLEELE